MKVLICLSYYHFSQTIKDKNDLSKKKKLATLAKVAKLISSFRNNVVWSGKKT